MTGMAARHATTLPVPEPATSRLPEPQEPGAEKLTPAGPPAARARPATPAGDSGETSLRRDTGHFVALDARELLGDVRGGVHHPSPSPYLALSALLRIRSEGSHSCDAASL